MATILKGAPVVAAMNERNAALCEQLKAKGITPTLAVVRVGEREDDLSYERGVIARCSKVGVEVKQFLLPADASQDDLLKVIAEVNASGRWPGKVVTEVKPAGDFWQAEPEHQDYLQRRPDGYTCHFPRPNWKLPQNAKG